MPSHHADDGPAVETRKEEFYVFEAETVRYILYIGTEKGGTFGWPVVGPMRSGGGAAGLRSFARRRSSKVFATGMCATADGTGL